MTGPPASVAATRVAVRQSVADLSPGGLALVACSGGTDSLALAAATAWEVPRLGARAGALVVDHSLQAASAETAAHAAEQCRRLGLHPVEVLTVVVGRAGGPESAARDARYRALSDAADRLDADQVLLGHTLDDQAEQVLLGIVRGSGARSLSGMPRHRGRFHRPFLTLPRSTTASACVAQGLVAWQDPHNQDTAYRRVRARQLLPIVEERLGPGVVAGLARTADRLREDADTLDELAIVARESLGAMPWEVSDVAALPNGLRSRVWRLAAREAGVPAGALVAVHVRAMDALVSRWHGQGAVDLPGGCRARRSGGRVVVDGRGQVQ